jgi:hypothetical protein
MLPPELMDKIVMYTGDTRVADALEPYITSYAYDSLEKSILVYGQVQGGKTKEIINILKTQRYNNVKKVLVVQNSLLVLKQYIARLKTEGISFQVIDRNTTVLKEDVIVVLNNKFRYNYFMKIINEKYILLLDEADQTYKNRPLAKAYKIFHITATPFYPKRSNIEFDKVIQVDTHTNYYGLDKVSVEKDGDIENALKDFFDTETGMMLINKYSYVEEMHQCALSLSRKHKLAPVVLLTSDKVMFLKGSNS